MKRDLTTIMSNTIKTDTECLVWTRCLNSDGYPRAVIDGNNNTKVHRVVFELVNGFLPETVMHTCDNPQCINPDHLVAGTPSKNSLDRHIKGRNASTRNRPSFSKVKAVWNNRDKPTAVLCREYGLSRASVISIKSGKTYGWINQQED